MRFHDEDVWWLRASSGARASSEEGTSTAHIHTTGSAPFANNFCEEASR
jgi:hypothetical protein